MQSNQNIKKEHMKATKEINFKLGKATEALTIDINYSRVCIHQSDKGLLFDGYLNYNLEPVLYKAQGMPNFIQDSLLDFLKPHIIRLAKTDKAIVKYCQSL